MRYCGRRVTISTDPPVRGFYFRFSRDPLHFCILWVLIWRVSFAVYRKRTPGRKST